MYGFTKMIELDLWNERDFSRTLLEEAAYRVWRQAILGENRVDTRKIRVGALKRFIFQNHMRVWDFEQLFKSGELEKKFPSNLKPYIIEIIESAKEMYRFQVDIRRICNLENYDYE
jgi:hypothetical protein